MLIATVTTTVSTASTATAISHRPIDPPRSRSAYPAGWVGMCSVGCARPRVGGGAESSEVRSASVNTFGASGASPLCTRIRSVRMSAAV
jgi:hypothetical protein